MNYNKRGLKQLLEQIMNGQISRLVLTHKDRLLRFGAELVFSLCAVKNVEAIKTNSFWPTFKTRLPMSKENLVLKLRIEADPQTISELDGQSRICNWLYNHLLEKSLELKREFIQSGNPEASKTLYTERGLRNELPKLKEEHPFLKVVHSSPLKNTALRLSEAIRVHQKSKKGKRKGEQMGWPKFRAWKRDWFSLFYDEPEKGFKIQGKALLLSFGMGQDRKHRFLTLELPGAHLLKGKTPRNLRIVSELGTYYAIFTIQKELPIRKPISKILALDPNHKNLAYGVDTSGTAIEIEFDEKGATRTCSHCLRIEEHGIPVSLRQWQCPQCKTVHIRDENAAINGLRKILGDLSPKNEGGNPSIVSSSDLAFIQKRWAWCVLPNGVHVTPWRQDCKAICSTRKLNRGHDSPRSKVDAMCEFS